MFMLALLYLTNRIHADGFNCDTSSPPNCIVVIGSTGGGTTDSGFPICICTPIQGPLPIIPPLTPLVTPFSPPPSPPPATSPVPPPAPPPSPSQPPPAQIDPYSDSYVIVPASRGRKLLDSNLGNFVGIAVASAIIKWDIAVATGELQALYGMAQGLWSFLTDPKTTVVNILYAGAHPGKTAAAIANQIKDSCIGPNKTYTDLGKCLGNAVANIGLLFIPIGEVAESGEATYLVKGLEMADREIVDTAQAEETANLLDKMPSCPNVFKRSPTSIGACIGPAAATNGKNLLKSEEYPKSNYLEGGPSKTAPEVLTMGQAYDKIIGSINAAEITLIQEDIKSFLATTKFDLESVEKAAQFTADEEFHFTAMQQIASFKSPGVVSLQHGFDYVGTSSKEIIGWHRLWKQTGFSNVDVLNREFQMRYGLNDHEARAVRGWTVSTANIDQVFLPKAFPKLPAFDGYLIRSTGLSDESVAILDTALKQGTAVDAKDVVINHAPYVPSKLPPKITTNFPSPASLPKPPGMAQEKWDAILANLKKPVEVAARAEYEQPRLKVMAASLAGRSTYGERPFRFYIRSKEGRFISPLSNTPGENEVIYLSGAKFKVLGKAKSPQGFTAYFFDELSANVVP